MRPERHAHHNELATELRGWFTNSAPEIDYFVTRHWFGYLANSAGPAGPRLILELDEPSQVARALDEARSQCANGDITIWIDDHSRHQILDGTLRDLGCRPIKATTHIALVGKLMSAGATDLVFETTGRDDLEIWADTKIRAFDNTDAVPSAERLNAEIAVRSTELALSRLTLARLDGEPVGVSAFYAGSDQLLFNVGTRVPFRHRGVAQAMLSHWVNGGLASGCRSLIINADDPGAPQMLYRHMGFVDEIYWYQRYELTNS